MSNYASIAKANSKLDDAYQLISNSIKAYATLRVYYLSI